MCVLVSLSGRLRCSSLLAASTCSSTQMNPWDLSCRSTIGSYLNADNNFNKNNINVSNQTHITTTTTTTTTTIDNNITNATVINYYKPLTKDLLYLQPNKQLQRHHLLNPPIYNQYHQHHHHNNGNNNNNNPHHMQIDELSSIKPVKLGVSLSACDVKIASPLTTRLSQASKLIDAKHALYSTTVNQSPINSQATNSVTTTHVSNSSTATSPTSSLYSLSSSPASSTLSSRSASRASYESFSTDDLNQPRHQPMLNKIILYVPSLTSSSSSSPSTAPTLQQLDQDITKSTDDYKKSTCSNQAIKDIVQIPRDTNNSQLQQQQQQFLPTAINGCAQLDKKARKKDQNRRAAHNYRRKKMEEKNRIIEEEMRLVYSRVCLIGYAEELENSIMYILYTKTKKILDKDRNLECYLCPVCLQSCDTTLNLRSHLNSTHHSSLNVSDNDEASVR